MIDPFRSVITGWDLTVTLRTIFLMVMVNLGPGVGSHQNCEKSYLPGKIKMSRKSLFRKMSGA